MSDVWASLPQAIVRVMLVTKLPKADAEEWLEAEIACGRVKSRNPFREGIAREWRTPIQPDDVGTKEAGPNWTAYWSAAEVAAKEEIEQASLEKALVNLVHPQPARVSASKPHRPQGSGMTTTDEPFVKMMHDLLVSKQANSKADAVKKVIAQNPSLMTGNTQEESVIHRLRDLYNKTYGNGE
ncbi:hypothetical protein [Mesorhizobium mediterraneum]|uniref:hypothetical protein n=1 Tax=Mesorhizobium mediterraneum TaxID=43617 RepID=UPI00177DB286|nr:hypothetical protein [Mesorhizobium mediterraneum]